MNHGLLDVLHSSISNHPLFSIGNCLMYHKDFLNKLLISRNVYCVHDEVPKSNKHISLGKRPQMSSISTSRKQVYVLEEIQASSHVDPGKVPPFITEYLLFDNYLIVKCEWLLYLYNLPLAFSAFPFFLFIAISLLRNEIISFKWKLTWKNFFNCLHLLSLKTIFFINMLETKVPKITIYL